MNSEASHISRLIGLEEGVVAMILDILESIKAVVSVEPFESHQVLVGELEVEDGHIFLNAARIETLDKDDEATINVEAQEDLMSIGINNTNI